MPENEMRDLESYLYLATCGASFSGERNVKLVNLETKLDYQLTPGENFKDRLPKRSDGKIVVTIDGTPVDAPVTVNKGWSGSTELTLSYPWFLFAGRCYYVTLAPGETLSGNFTVQNGVATRKNPTRVTAKVSTEAERIAKFRATWIARNPVKVETPAPAPAPVETKKDEVEEVED